jgi:hypothetical protein
LIASRVDSSQPNMGLTYQCSARRLRSGGAADCHDHAGLD